MTRYISKGRESHINMVSVVNKLTKPKKRVDKIGYKMDIVVISENMNKSLETGDFDLEFAVILN